MNVAIVGFEIEGRAAFAYWSDLGAKITICDHDTNKQIPASVDTQLGEGYLKNLDRFDIIFRTAGINPKTILQENPTVAGKITTTINEFLRVSPTKKVIGITGTKGKGTTSVLTAKMLEAAGEEVFLGGNIGLSPFEFLHKLKPTSWVVLELSSFQLIDLKYSPSLAICLMVVPEHLNWHDDMDDYIMAKSRLFEHQTPNDMAIYLSSDENSRKIVGYSPGLKMPYFTEPGAHIDGDTISITGQEICQTSELKLIGRHNWQNVCAALTAVWQITQNVIAIRSVLTSFSGLKHRLELVAKIDGVKYYDDSFGTTPETAIVAIEAFSEPKVLILGGSDKGADFNALATAVASGNVKQVISVGDMAEAIEVALHEKGYNNITPGGSTMPEVVRAAQEAAQPGDIVLLSPACASFDMFTDYKDRGDQFARAVNALINIPLE